MFGYSGVGPALRDGKEGPDRKGNDGGHKVFAHSHTFIRFQKFCKYCCTLKRGRQEKSVLVIRTVFRITLYSKLVEQDSVSLIIC